MRAKVLAQRDDLRMLCLVFDSDEEVVGTLTGFLRDHQVTAARFTAIGAFSDVVLGYFDWDRKAYLPIEVHEQVEVLSLLGDVALEGSQPKAHAHAVLGRRDGSTCGGHLMKAHVRPTLELILDESPGYLRKEYDAQAHLPLIKIGT